MAKLKIFWTQTALDQRNEIFHYWNKRNKSTEYSKKLNRSIKERTAILKSNPLIGIETDFIQTRMISLGHYSILYKVMDRQIIVTGLWDNRQAPEKILDFLRKK